MFACCYCGITIDFLFFLPMALGNFVSCSFCRPGFSWSPGVSCSPNALVHSLPPLSDQIVATPRRVSDLDILYSLASIGYPLPYQTTRDVLFLHDPLYPRATLATFWLFSLANRALPSKCCLTSSCHVLSVGRYYHLVSWVSGLVLSLWLLFFGHLHRCVVITCF